MSALPPGLPPAVYDMQRDIAEQIVPTKPHAVYAAPQAKLPPASSFPNCQAWLTDTKALVVSDGANWINIMTGAPI